MLCTGSHSLYLCVHRASETSSYAEVASREPKLSEEWHNQGRTFTSRRGIVRGVSNSQVKQKWAPLLDLIDKIPSPYLID